MATVELTATQIDFLENYLDAVLPDTVEDTVAVIDPDDESLDVSDLWMRAHSDVDAAIDGFRAVLIDHDEPNLQRIAEFGLLDLLGGHNTRITAQIIAYRAADPDSRVARAAALSAALTDLETHLAASALIDLVEDNAFDVPVAIRAPLQRAVTAIRKKIAA